MKKFAKTMASFALALGAFAFAGGLSACGGKTQETERPTNVDITKTAAPTDGSLPTAHSAAENLAYVAYVLDSQPQYHCYTYTVTNASIATQYTKSYKDYKNGVTVSSDITYSSMVKSGSQALFVNGENGPEAYMRYSEAPDANTNHLNARWSNDAPIHFSEQAYLYTYGLFQTELTNYIINADTIIDSDEIKVNSDGTYTQRVILDPVASTYYYQYGMKTRGNLGSFPDFQSVKLAVTFDSSWRVTALDIDEVSLVNKGVTVTSTSVSRAEYSYGEETFDSAHFAFYNDYFKQYVGSSELEEGGDTKQEMVVDLTNVLSNGFSRIMNGGQQFEVKALLGENYYYGYIFLGLDLADPLNTLEARVSLGKTMNLQDQVLYIEYKDGEAQAYYGENVALSVNIAALKPHIAAFSQWMDQLNSVLNTAKQDNAATFAEDGGDPVADLMKAMQLEASKSEAKIILKTDDLLGLGVGIDATLSFGLTEDRISFRAVSVKEISIGGDKINLSLNLKSTTADIISHENTGANADLAEYVADVYKLLSSDLIRIDLSLDGNDEKVKISGLKGLTMSASAYVDIDGVTVGADLDIAYSRGQDKISATINVYYDYEPGSATYGKLVVTVTSVNGIETCAQVCCDISELADAVTPLLQAAGVQSSALTSSKFSLDADLVGIINGVLSADFSEVISDLYADKAQLKVAVNIDELLNALNVDAGVQFGKCNLVYRTGAAGGVLSASLPAIGFALDVTGADGEITNPKGENCLDLTDLVNAVNAVYGQITEISQASRLTFTVSENTVISYGKAKAGLSGFGEVCWKDGEEVVALDLKVTLVGNAKVGADLKLIYNKNAGESLPLVRLAIGGAAMDIYARDIEGVKTQIDSLASSFASPSFSVETGDSEQLFSVVFALLASTDWVEELNNFTLTSDGASVALTYLSDAAASVTLAADGALRLAYDIEYKEFTAAAEISVDAQGSVAEILSDEIDAMSPSSTANGDSLIKLIYDFVFDGFNSIDITGVLGESYGLSVSLDGDSSPVPALAGIKADASLGFASCSAGNVADLMLDLTVDGVRVKINLTIIGEDIYASLENICDYDIPHLKIKTTADSLYSLVADLVDTAVNSGILSSSFSADTNTEEVKQLKLTVSTLVTTLVEFDWDSAFICAQVNGTRSVTLDLDSIVSQLGASAGYSLGCVQASVTANGDRAPEFSVSAENGGKTWLSVCSFTQNRDYENIDANEYIDFSEVTALNIVDILNLVNAENLVIDLSIDNQTYGISAEGAVYLNARGLTVGVEDLTVTYIYSGSPISVTLSAYYAEDNIYLHLTRVNGLDCAVSVACNITEMSEAVSALLSSAQITAGGLQTEVSVDVQNLIEKALTADFPAIVSGVYSDKNGLGVSIDTDKLLSELGVDLGLSLGKIKLNYVAGNSTLGGTLTVAAQDFGLSLSLSGSEKAPSNLTEDCLDLTELVNLINDALENRTFEICIDFGGAEIAGIDLSGIQAEARALVNLGDTPWAYATVSASYALNSSETVSLSLEATYESVEGKNYVYLTLTSINGIDTNVSVYCEIGELTSAVEQFITLVNGEAADNSGVEAYEAEESEKAADVIAALLSVDFETLVTELKANSEGLKISVNLDNVLALFVENFEVSLGTVTLEYIPATGEGSATVPAKICGSLPQFNLGVSASVSTAQKPALPENPIDLSELVNTVNAAYRQITEIVDNQSAYFEIDSDDVYISVDGLTAGVYGSGEIVWKQGCESVALDLSVYISENGASDVADVRIVYDKNATDRPMILIALNKVAIEIYSDDIEGFKRDFDNLYNTICQAFGISSGSAQVQTASIDEGAASGNDELFTAIFGVLAGTDWVEALNKFTLSTDGSSVALSGLVSTLNDKYNTSLTLSTDGALTLEYSVEDFDNSVAFSTGGKVTISSARPQTDGYASLAEAIRAYVNDHNNGFVVSSTADPQTPSFSKLVFDYLFDAFDCLSFENILGTNTYGVEFLLDGNSCNIPALEGVYVNANLYFTGKTKDTGNITDEANLTEADIDVDVNGVAIKINVVLNRVNGTTYLYINLNRVADVHLPDLKVVATENDIYNVIEEIINIATRTNALDFVSGMFGSDGAEAVSVETEEAQVSEQTKSTLADIISKILKLDFSDSLYGVATDSESGQKITTVYFDIDELLRQLEIECDYEVGRA
ncbi:MAG: hypothetical protein ACI4L9_04175, partial [Candidatus Coproplasma sp.]